MSDTEIDRLLQRLNRLEDYMNANHNQAATHFVKIEDVQNALILDYNKFKSRITGLALGLGVLTLVFQAGVAFAFYIR